MTVINDRYKLKKTMRCINVFGATEYLTLDKEYEVAFNGFKFKLVDDTGRETYVTYWRFAKMGKALNDLRKELQKILDSE